MALVPTAAGLARPAEAIHGYCKMSRPPLAPAMATETIHASAARRKAKPSTPAAMTPGAIIQIHSTVERQHVGIAAILQRSMALITFPSARGASTAICSTAEAKPARIAARLSTTMPTTAIPMARG